MDTSSGRDDLARLKAERDAADREYNDALTRLDRAIQQLPADFPRPPPAPDEHQVTPLNTLWKIDVPPFARLDHEPHLQRRAGIEARTESRIDCERS